MTGAEIAVVLGASLVGAFVKSVTGMGYPLFAVPLMTLVLGVEDAVVIVAVPNAVANVVLCYDARRGRHAARDLRRIVGAGVVGAVIGAFALVSIPSEPILVALVVSVVVFAVNYVRASDVAIDPTTGARWAPVVGGLAGLMQGAVGVSGPVVATWYHGYRLPKQTFVYTVTLIFGVTGFVQIVVLTATGAVTSARALASALAFVPVVAMIPVGTGLRTRLGGRAFERAILAVLLTSAAALVLRVLS